MQRLVFSRYGDDERRIRDNVLHLTILNELVIPDPEVRFSKELGHLTDFAADAVKRDHIDILNNLFRFQKFQQKGLQDILVKKGLKKEFFLDLGRDRSTPNIENFWHDVDALIKMNEEIDASHHLFKGKKRRPLPDAYVPRPVDDGSDPSFDESLARYLSQFQHSKPLSTKEIHKVALAIQWIYRDFSSITRTKFPEYLKFKSSVEKVIKRERTKLNTLFRDLPNVSIVGTFELELIDVVHALDGTNHHPNKVETLRLLAGQSRKRGVRSEDCLITDDLKSGTVKSRLLDNLRTQINEGGSISFEQYPEFRYAVLLHIHALVDLNGTPRKDFEKWLHGKGESKKRFKGKWPLSRQVKLDKLHTDRKIPENLISIGFYPFKPALEFNYDLIENSTADPDLKRGSKEFSHQELSTLVWLQNLIGFQGLSIRINAAVDYETKELPSKPGRKKKQSAMSVIPQFTQFQDDLHRLLENQGRLDSYLSTLGEDMDDKLVRERLRAETSRQEEETFAYLFQDIMSEDDSQDE